MENPNDGSSIKGFGDHGIKNYTGKEMYDKDGYFIPNVLYDEVLFAHPGKSPLELKDNGIHNFNIAIKTFIMQAFAEEVNKSVTLIENSEKSLSGFLDFYTDVMTEVKNKYYRIAGNGDFDLLYVADVDDIFQEFGENWNGIPLLFSMEQYEEIVDKTKVLQTDTEEIAFHMNEMAGDFDETDTLLAQWLKL